MIFIILILIIYSILCMIFMIFMIFILIDEDTLYLRRTESRVLFIQS